MNNQYVEITERREIPAAITTNCEECNLWSFWMLLPSSVVELDEPAIRGVR
jgi:hypothetical protein